MMEKKQIFVGILIFICILFVSFTGLKKSLTITPYEVGNKSTSTKILVATENSDFKNYALDKIINSFDKDTYFKIINIKDINKENHNIFNKTIVFNSVWFGKIDGSVKSLVSIQSNKDKIILIATSGSGEWNNPANIDAITVATKKNQDATSKDIIVEDILKKIHKTG